MLLKTTVAALAALAISAGAAQANCDDGEIVIKFSHVTNTDKHPKGIAAELLKERVNAEMQGKACMEVYPSSTLYDDDKVLEAMLLGDVQMAAPSLSKFETFTKKFRLFDLPFIFADVGAADRYLASPDAASLYDSMQRKGLQGLAFWYSGMKQFSGSKPLMTPADAAGMKFRVQPSDVLVAMIEAIGGNPQKMAFSEVYGALQQGVVDGQENSWCNIYGQKFFEVQDGTTETNHGLLAYLVVVSTEWWDSLPGDVRDQLGTIVKEVTAERNAAITDVEAKCRASILEAGGEIRELTPEQREAWVEAMKPVWEQFEGDVGADTIQQALSYNATN